MLRFSLVAAIIGSTLCAPVLTQTPTYAPNEGLVLFMDFNGDVNDDSGSGNNGTSNGIQYTTDRFENPGMAAEFGSNRWVEVSHSASIDFASGDSLTWSVWVKTETSNVGQTIFHKWNGIVQSTSYPLQAAVSSAGENTSSGTFCVNNQSTHGYVNSSIELGEWTHLLMTQTPDSTILFINGFPADTGLVNQTGCSNNTSLTFGRKFGVYPRYFQGDMDDFGLWNRVLSNQEIQSLYINDQNFGCIDPAACNYEPNSNVDDGSCLPSGCMLNNACNYNPEAGCDNGSCVFPPLVELGATTTICEGEALTLEVDASGLDVIWNTGVTESSITVSESGTYKVQIGDDLSANHRLEFDGVDDYMSYGSSLDITTYPFSIQADIIVPDDYFPILNTDDGTDGYSGIWIDLTSTSLSISVGEGQNGGSSNRRSKGGSHGLTVGDHATITAVVRGATDMSLYVNGSDIGGSYSGTGNTNFVDNGLDAVTGRYTPSSGALENQLQYYNGSIDNLHVWTKALTADEVTQYTSVPATGTESDLLALYTFDEGGGATATDSANGNLANLFGSPSWTQAPNGCGASDSVSVYFIDCASLCGPGTHWDFNTSSCIISAPADVDLDGCTGVSDVLEVLSQFGACYTQESSAWNCGDPVSYWDYDYATVLIGDQCWFAENLRSTKYQSGETIPFPNNWSHNDIPKMSSYGHSNITCSDNYALFDACNNPVTALNEFGALYDYHAVVDSNGICPSGWRAPSSDDWLSLTSETEALFPGQAGSALKSNFGWVMSADSIDQNGSNAMGFNMLPAGNVSLFYFGFAFSGKRAWYWTTGPGCKARYLHANSESFVTNCSNGNDGHSVRCVKD